LGLSVVEGTIAIVGLLTSSSGTGSQELAIIGHSYGDTTQATNDLIFFEVACINAGGSANLSVSLYDFTNQAVVPNSTVNGSTTTPYGVYRAGPINPGDMPWGNVYGVQFTNANITIARVVAPVV